MNNIIQFAPYAAERNRLKTRRDEAEKLFHKYSEEYAVTGSKWSSGMAAGYLRIMDSLEARI